MSPAHTTPTFREVALRAVDDGMRSPLHPPSDHELAVIASELVRIYPEVVVEQLALSIRAAIEERAHAFLGGGLHVVDIE